MQKATAPDIKFFLTRPSRPFWLLNCLLFCLFMPLGLACGESSATGSSSPSSETQQQLSGYTRDPVPIVADVAVPVATDGSLQIMVARTGGLRLMYFGYTSCPDVCPTTMSDLKRALALLKAQERARIDVNMLTVDPARDLPEKISAYVTSFIPTAVALRTEDESLLRSSADAFGANFSLEVSKDGRVDVGHTAEIYAVDDSGRVVMQWPFGSEYPMLAKDLEALLAQQQ
jgi:protein SCO1/2